MAFKKEGRALGGRRCTRPNPRLHDSLSGLSTGIPDIRLITISLRFQACDPYLSPFRFGHRRTQVAREACNPEIASIAVTILGKPRGLISPTAAQSLALDLLGSRAVGSETQTECDLRLTQLLR